LRLSLDQQYVAVGYLSGRDICLATSTRSLVFVELRLTGKQSALVSRIRTLGVGRFIAFVAPWILIRDLG